MSGCSEFRRGLEGALAGRARPVRLAALSFDGHLAACGDCRELLASEQALEALLDSLPEPRLPADLARRVLARLRRERERALDALLDEDVAPAAPAGLARRIVERARAQADPLDRLLDRVPAPRAPADLARRVVAAARAEGRRRRFRVLRGLGWLAAAAAVVALLLLVRERRREPVGPLRDGRVDVAELAPAADPPSEELLAAFAVLESWDWATASDLDLLLASFDELDQVAVEEGVLDAARAEGESGG